MAGYELPPHKRPRLEAAGSPPAMSPYGVTPSPTTPGIQLYGAPNPYSFNSPQPLHTPGGSAYDNQSLGAPLGTPGGVMGPPARPADRPQAEKGAERPAKDNSVDMNSLMDVMSGTGVDLKAEEAAMMASYRDSQQNASFGSSQTMSMTPGNSFDARNLSFPSGGVLSQTASQQRVEDEVAAQQRRTARLYNERQQQPLYNPFLQINVIRQKLSDMTKANGVRFPLEGLYVKSPPLPQTSVMNGANGADSIVKVEAGSWVQSEAPIVDVFSLLSLAANERLRSLCDDAYGLARGRQSSADGVVDPRWADLAVGTGKASDTTAVPLSVSHTAWDQADGAITPVSRTATKRPLEDTNGNHNRLPTPPSERSPTPKPTKAFTNTNAAHLRTLAKQQLELERARLTARQKRQNAADAAANGGATADGSSATPGTTTPGTPAGSVHADLPMQQLSKKAQDKQRKAQENNPTSQLNAASRVLNKALGGKRYSWMSGGASDDSKSASTPGSKVGAPAGGPVTPGATAGSRPAAGVAKAGEPGLVAKNRRIGEWREDGKGGAGVQIRDLLHVLDQDGKAKRTYVKVLSDLKSGDKPEDTEIVDAAQQ